MRQRRAPRLIGLAGLLAVLALVAGCVRMPVSGPIQEVTQDDPADRVAGTFYDPRPPAPGASGQEIVAGFLEAMKATPIRTTVAVEFLSAGAQEGWKPENGTLTYSDLGALSGSELVTVPLVDAESYDSRGAWSRSLTGDDARLRFPLVREDGEWRIDRAPDAMVVPESWFQDRFERASLHFLDPTGRILVPEPVFAPSGDQFATALVRGLLAGPPDGLDRVARTAFPPRLSLALSVPIDSVGVAEVALEGPSGLQTENLVSEEMVAQLAWTLRQEPRIRAVRLTLDGRPLPLPDGEPEISLDAGARFDPDGARSSTELFALREGLLVRGELDDLEATTGPFGSQVLGLRSLGINLTGEVAAGVTESGTSVLSAPVDDPEATAVEVLSGAADLLPPAWDFSDRMWLVDRTSRGARVWVVVDGEPRSVVVPGLSGADVTAFLVSRDGSRLVAAVRDRRSDHLVASRVLHHDSGRVLRVTRAREINLELERGRRINDIGWRSPVSVTLLSDVTGDLAQVRTVAVEGAPGDLDTGGASRIRGRSASLVSSPVRGESVYVVGPDGVTDLVDPVRQIPDLDEQVTWLGYVG